MRRSTTAALAAAVIILPAGTAWAAMHSSATTAAITAAKQPTATPTASTKHTSTKHTTKKTTKAKPTTVAPIRTIHGASEDMRWGPVQVTLIVKGKKITDVQATAPTERERSAFINNQAIPWLRQEVLQAQSANIDLISGATMTSEAFVASLQTALQQAHI